MLQQQQAANHRGWSAKRHATKGTQQRRSSSSSRREKRRRSPSVEPPSAPSADVQLLRAIVPQQQQQQQQVAFGPGSSSQHPPTGRARTADPSDAKGALERSSSSGGGGGSSSWRAKRPRSPGVDPSADGLPLVPCIEVQMLPGGVRASRHVGYPALGPVLSARRCMSQPERQGRQADCRPGDGGCGYVQQAGVWPGSGQSAWKGEMGGLGPAVGREDGGVADEGQGRSGGGAVGEIEPQGNGYRYEDGRNYRAGSLREGGRETIVTGVREQQEQQRRQGAPQRGMSLDRGECREGGNGMSARFGEDTHRQGAWRHDDYEGGRGMRGRTCEAKVSHLRAAEAGMCSSIACSSQTCSRPRRPV
jgi:hypothetical protein